MKKNLYSKLLVLLLLITLSITFGFTTGFTKQDSKIAGKEGIPLLDEGEEVLKWTCTCGFIYDPEETGINFEDLPDDWVCPDCGASKDEFTVVVEEEEEVLKWTCTCGFIYDPEETGINFEDLPDDWVCPECGMPRGSFNADITLDEVDSRLTHLQHVMAMRMKHIAVLLRVQEAKDIDQHSKEAIGHAIIQSSKSIFKAQEAIVDYLTSLNGSTEDTTTESNSTSSIEEEDENNGKENKPDKGEKSNNGKGNKPDKDEKSNNGKGKGKNK
jgi:rubredoxin